MLREQGKLHHLQPCPQWPLWARGRWWLLAAAAGAGGGGGMSDVSLITSKWSDSDTILRFNSLTMRNRNLINSEKGKGRNASARGSWSMCAREIAVLFQSQIIKEKIEKPSLSIWLKVFGKRIWNAKPSDMSYDPSEPGPFICTCLDKSRHTDTSMIFMVSSCRAGMHHSACMHAIHGIYALVQWNQRTIWAIQKLNLS